MEKRMFYKFFFFFALANYINLNVQIHIQKFCCMIYKNKLFLLQFYIIKFWKKYQNKQSKVKKKNNKWWTKNILAFYLNINYYQKIKLFNCLVILFIAFLYY